MECLFLCRISKKQQQDSNQNFPSFPVQAQQDAGIDQLTTPSADVRAEDPEKIAESQQRAFLDPVSGSGTGQPRGQPEVVRGPVGRSSYGATQPGYAVGVSGPTRYSGGESPYAGGGGGGAGYGGGAGGAAYAGGATVGSGRYSPFAGGIGGGTGFGYPSGGAPYPYGAYGGFGYGYRPYYLGYNYDLAPYGIPQPQDFVLYGKNTLHPEKTYYSKGAFNSNASGGTGK